MIEADLARRDFTVNAMALRLSADDDDPELIDPFGGAADLVARVLRTPLSPDESFSDDPLRMMRAARFVARYGLEPEPELVDAIRHLGDRLSIVSAERVRDELDKLLVVPDPSPGSVAAGGHRPGRRRSCPSCRPCASSRIRSTATRTCWPTPSRWWPRPGPSASCAWPRCCTTWASPRPAPSGPTA